MFSKGEYSTSTLLLSEARVEPLNIIVVTVVHLIGLTTVAIIATVEHFNAHTTVTIKNHSSAFEWPNHCGHVATAVRLNGHTAVVIIATVVRLIGLTTVAIIATVAHFNAHTTAAVITTVVPLNGLTTVAM